MSVLNIKPKIKQQNQSIHLILLQWEDLSLKGIIGS